MIHIKGVYETEKYGTWLWFDQAKLSQGDKNIMPKSTHDALGIGYNPRDVTCAGRSLSTYANMIKAWLQYLMGQA